MTWKPSASIEILQQRSQLIDNVRQFFYKRGYLEVETPALGCYGTTDVYLSPIKAHFQDQAYFLQTSPEYHMKRLLAAGSGPIFQIAKVFRNDELGKWHNPEFTMLEWYQLGIDHHQLMDEVEALFFELLRWPPLIKKTYQQIFTEICDIDPFNTDVSRLKKTLGGYGLQGVLSEAEEDIDQYLFLLMSHIIEPELAKDPNPIAIYHFPPSQAALAQVHQGVAERFEIYVKGIELANGFHELLDHEAQASRFQADLKTRKRLKLAEMTPDPLFLEALKSGLPPCSGIALGIDRLLALALNQTNIAAVMAFDFTGA